MLLFSELFSNAQNHMLKYVTKYFTNDNLLVSFGADHPFANCFKENPMTKDDIFKTRKQYNSEYPDAKDNSPHSV